MVTWAVSAKPQNPDQSRTEPWRPSLIKAGPSNVPSCRTYLTYAELCADYESGALHPGDLKPALAKHINTILQPVKGHGDELRCAKCIAWPSTSTASCSQRGLGGILVYDRRGRNVSGVGAVQHCGVYNAWHAPLFIALQVRDHFENNAEAKALLKQVGCGGHLCSMHQHAVLGLRLLDALPCIRPSACLLLGPAAGQVVQGDQVRWQPDWSAAAAVEHFEWHYLVGHLRRGRQHCDTTSCLPSSVGHSCGFALNSATLTVRIVWPAQ